MENYQEEASVGNIIPVNYTISHVPHPSNCGATAPPGPCLPPKAPPLFYFHCSPPPTCYSLDLHCNPLDNFLLSFSCFSYCKFVGEFLIEKLFFPRGSFHFSFSRCDTPILLTYLITPWCRVLLDKLTVCESSQEFPLTL